MAASICGFRSSSTFCLVTCFSTSVSRCDEMVPTLKRSCFALKLVCKWQTGGESVHRRVAQRAACGHERTAYIEAEAICVVDVPPLRLLGQDLKLGTSERLQAALELGGRNP